jgi:leader peptidase (prepilin peptidase)/N-methyltransferase
VLTGPPADDRQKIRRYALWLSGLFVTLAIPVLPETDISPEWIVATLLLGGALVALAAIDAVTFRLPDLLTLPLLGIGLLGAAFTDGDVPYWHLLSAAAGGLLLFGVGWLYKSMRGRHGLGLGDVKLFAAAGAWLGGEGLPSVLLVACLTAILTLAYVLIRRGKLRAGTAIPFGPFLALGFWAIWIYGPLA